MQSVYSILVVEYVLIDGVMHQNETTIFYNVLLSPSLNQSVEWYIWLPPPKINLVDLDKMNSFLQKYLRPIFYKREPLIFEVEEEDEITDEIEKSLWLIKEALDLPTEEIEAAVASRKRNTPIKRFRN